MFCHPLFLESVFHLFPQQFVTISFSLHLFLLIFSILIITFFEAINWYQQPFWQQSKEVANLKQFRSPIKSFLIVLPIKFQKIQLSLCYLNENLFTLTFSEMVKIPSTG